MMSRTHLAKLAVVLIFVGRVTHAQSGADTATVLGTVTDNQKAVLPGVTVTVRNVDTGFIRTALTDGNGSFRIPAILPGQYEVKAELQGFQPTTRKGVTLTVGAEAVIDFTLQLAAVEESLTVTADVPIVETTTAAVGMTMTQDQVASLPTRSRNYQDFLRVAPTATTTSDGLSLAGSRGRSNQWQIDGVDNRSDLSGLERQSPALDSIQEFQVLTDSYKAEYGHASGGVINVITRSGSNKFHGSAFGQFTNESLTSRSPYANRALPADPNRVKYQGGSFGGPIVKDKMNFFGTYEWKNNRTVTSATDTLPVSTAAFSDATRLFLRQNGIDPALFGNGGTVRLTVPTTSTEPKTAIRVDRQFSVNQSLTVRYMFNRPINSWDQDGSFLAFNGQRTWSRQNYGTVADRWILGSNKLNELSFQLGRTIGTSDVNFPDVPNVTVTGAFSLGGNSNFPQARTETVYQIVEKYSWTKTTQKTGEHVVKFGADVKGYSADGFTYAAFRPTFTFPTLQAFIAGTPSRFQQTVGDGTIDNHDVTTGLFVQDDWRPRRDLTVNAGLRYDYQSAKFPVIDPAQPQGPGVSHNKTNFAPRLAFTWALGNSTKHAVYGGAGVYYDEVNLNNFNGASFTPPRQYITQIDNPRFPDWTAGGTVARPPSTVRIFDPNMKVPHNVNTSFGYRRELRSDVGLDVSVLYNRGWNQMNIIDLNTGRPGSATVLGAGAVRPDPTVTSRLFYTDAVSITYKAMIVNLKKRLSHNVQGGLAYTLGSAVNNGFNLISRIQVPTNPELNVGPDDADARHRLSAHAEVNLPWDVMLATIVEYRSALPLDVVPAGRDVNGDGTLGEWVNQAICLTISCPGFNYSRNSVRQLATADANQLRTLFGLTPITDFQTNPNYWNADLMIQKQVRFGQSHRAQVAVQAVNVFNLPQRTLPVANIVATNFGQYTAVAQPRVVQFLLRYAF